jgi:DNA topoisomerase-1
MAKKSIKSAPVTRASKEATVKASEKAPAKKTKSQPTGAAGSGKKLVIVESPTKAKTIRKFLGREYIVESCMGHIRDLPQSAKDIPEKYKKEKWAHLGVNVEEHFEPIYCVPKNKTKIVSALKDRLTEADELILATDEDREGESISWHLVNLLKPKVPVKRMVFHEITKEAIENALTEFREIDMNLVRAQEARRILDRLVGYTISPLLWKKVSYGLSAGRVQSVAVRLIAEREMDRIRFKKSIYWDLTAEHEKQKIEFESRIYTYKGKRIASGKDFDSLTGELLKEKQKDIVVFDEELAKKVNAAIAKSDWLVTDVDEKPISRKPSPPFITSTLQQEANRKLGLSSRETMQVAQKLYEKGMITYMRTDSTVLSEQAIQAARKEILNLYGKQYLPSEYRDYGKKKVKGAQEAHEAIRPAGTSFQLPEEAGLQGVELKLYDLIWKRTMASQMVNSEHKQVSIRYKVDDSEFSSSGMTTEFQGYLKAYVEGTDSDDADEKNMPLPMLKKGEILNAKNLRSDSHETKPPARYTEASLIQMMEKEGIGRPSTYAAIIGTIQDRGYVRKMGNALVPTFTALIVSKLLSQYLPKFVETQFTSSMESSLDDIAQGDLDQEKYLTQIYFGDQGLKNQVAKQEKDINEEESRSIFLIGMKDYVFRVGRYGAYVCRIEGKGKEVCASIPDIHTPGEMTPDVANKIIEQKLSGADSIGKDPETGLPVFVLSGRYGPYVQLGEVQNDKDRLKRMALPPGFQPDQIKLEKALWLLKLPMTLGEHPVTKKDVKLGIGRFGPYVVHDGDYRSVPKTEVLFEMNFTKSMDLLSQPKKGRGAKTTPLKELGSHPDLKAPIQVLNGRYGPYIKCGKINVSLGEGLTPDKVTLQQAMDLINNKEKPTKKTRQKRANA